MYDFRYLFVPKDAISFLSWAVSWANVYFWSSAMLDRVDRRVTKAFGGIKKYFSGWAGQRLCDVGAYCLPGGSPAFFKVLQNFLDKVGRYGERNVLIIDKSTYKCHYNPPGTYIIVPSIEQRHTDWLTNDLLEWLIEWQKAEDKPDFATTFKNSDNTDVDKYVTRAIQEGEKKTSYEAFEIGPTLKPLKFR